MFIICYPSKTSALKTRSHNQALSLWELWDIGAVWSQEGDDTGDRDGGWWLGDVRSHLPVGQDETMQMAVMKPHFSLPVVTLRVIWCAALLVSHGNASGSLCQPILTVFSQC